MANLDGKDQTNALWNSYPREVHISLFFEISQKEEDRYADDSMVIFVWGREEHRAGGYEKIDEIANAAT